METENLCASMSVFIAMCGAIVLLMSPLYFFIGEYSFTVGCLLASIMMLILSTLVLILAILFRISNILKGLNTYAIDD